MIIRIVMSILLMLGGVAGAGTAWAADGHDRAETLVVWGHWGYLKRDAQASLAAILDAGRGTALGRERDALASFSDDLVSRPAVGQVLNQWSSHPLVRGESDVAAAYQRAHGRPAQPKHLENPERYFDRAYALILIGGFEDHSPLKTSVDIRGQVVDLHHDYFTATVTAVLFDLKSDEIVLSATATTVRPVKEQDRPVTGPVRIAGFFREAYQGAADKALTRLTRIMGQTAPDTVADRFDTYMVTSVDMAPATGREGLINPRAVFQFDGYNAQDDDFCPRQALCRNRDPACKSFVSMMANGVTSALSQAGHLTMPPWGVSDWRARSNHKISVSLALPQFDSPMAKRALEFTIDPRKARYKVRARLDGITLRQPDSGSRYVTHNRYFALVSHTATKTRMSADGAACIPRGDPVEAAGADFVGVYADNPPSHLPPVTGKMERMFYFAAINCSLRKHGDPNEVCDARQN